MYINSLERKLNRQVNTIHTMDPSLEQSPPTQSISSTPTPTSYFSFLFLSSPLKHPPLDELAASFIGTFISMSSILLICQYTKLPTSSSRIQMFASFGASAALVHGAPHSPLAQPRNAWGGQFIGGLSGILWRLIIDGPELQWLAGALAVATSMLAMQLSATLHPPAAATALIFCLSYTRDTILSSGDGFMALVLPLAVGVIIQFISAILCNGFTRKKKYPLDWFTR